LKWEWLAEPINGSVFFSAPDKTYSIVKDRASPPKQDTRQSIASSVKLKKEMDSPLLVFACDREQYLNRTLTAVFNHHPAIHQGKGGYMASPIIVSQDGNNRNVRDVINKFKKKFEEVGVLLIHTIHIKTPLVMGLKPTEKDYKPLTVHYGWALHRLFNGTTYREDDNNNVSPLPLPRRVVILEDDLLVAKDFFSFMYAMTPLLESDPTLLAVSAFNDNGKNGFDEKRVVRSDFFPGLGEYKLCGLNGLLFATHNKLFFLSFSRMDDITTHLGRADSKMARHILGRLAT